MNKLLRVTIFVLVMVFAAIFLWNAVFSIVQWLKQEKLFVTNIQDLALILIYFIVLSSVCKKVKNIIFPNYYMRSAVATSATVSVPPLGRAVLAPSALNRDKFRSPKIREMREKILESLPVDNAYQVNNLTFKAINQNIALDDVPQFVQENLSSLNVRLNFSATALHESGHAVVAAKLGIPVQEVVCYSNTDGFTQLAYDSKSCDGAWDRVRVQLAGALTEKIFMPKSYAGGSISDYTNADANLNILHNVYDMGESVEQLLKKAITETEAIIDDNKELIRYISQQFKPNAHMSQSELLYHIVEFETQEGGTDDSVPPSEKKN